MARRAIPHVRKNDHNHIGAELFNIPKILLLLLYLFLSNSFAEFQEILTVDLVEVYVSALDSKDNPVEDLTREDFVLKDQGVEQPITNFARLLAPDSKIPLTMAFLMDISGSMDQEAEKIPRIEIARTFSLLVLEEVKSGDMMQVFAFDVAIRSLTPMTSDKNVIDEALSKVNIDSQGSPGTALLFSLDITIKQLEKHSGRKILILCSDGENNVPGPRQDDLLESLRSSDITLLALGTTDIHAWKGFPGGGPPSDIGAPFSRPPNTSDIRWESSQGSKSKRAKNLMKNLAEGSGGHAFFPKEVSELNEQIEKLRSVVRSQYMLAFRPTKQQSGKLWRKIEVKCKRKGVTLRYRQGYFGYSP